MSSRGPEHHPLAIVGPTTLSSGSAIDHTLSKCHLKERVGEHRNEGLEVRVSSSLWALGGRHEHTFYSFFSSRLEHIRPPSQHTHTHTVTICDQSIFWEHETLVLRLCSEFPSMSTEAPDMSPLCRGLQVMMPFDTHKIHSWPTDDKTLHPSPHLAPLQELPSSPEGYRSSGCCHGNSRKAGKGFGRLRRYRGWDFPGSAVRL